MDAPRPTLGHRSHGPIDLEAVATSLRGLQRDFARALGSASAGRDPLDHGVVENMVAGYDWVDALLAEGIDPLTPGSLKYLLEMNTLVLCGTDPTERHVHAGHIQATERRFYGEREGGVRDLVEWYAGHQDDSALECAAGLYVLMLSKPQLFIEGNHRTAALVMSYVLVRDGRPPFVLSVHNAAEYFASAAAIRDVHKNSSAMLFRAPAFRQRVVRLLERSDHRHLLA